MKTILAFAFTLLLLTHSILAAERPSGHETPEGIACDAVQAYADCDSEAWLNTLVRPIYGKENNEAYEEFKAHMVRVTDGNNENEGFVAPTIVKVFKARNFSMNGPSSLAYAMHQFKGNMFVDVVLDLGDGREQVLRYHVLFDEDDKWYFEPRPDLAPIFAMGLNDELPSEEILWERQPDGDPVGETGSDSSSE